MCTERQYYVYILASQKNGTVYVGVTNNLINRVHQHKQKQIEGFTKKYNITSLVYYEVYADIREAIEREKNLKRWKREWKLRLIEQGNPNWHDLFQDLTKGLSI